MTAHLESLMYHTAKADTYIDFHRHNYFELVYYLTGTGKMVIENTSYDYKPRSLTLTRPKLFHDEKRFEESEILFIGFSYDDDPERLKNGVFADPTLAIYQLLLRMKQEMMQPKSFHSHLMDLLVNQIVLELLRTGITEHRPKKDKLLYAIRTLEENYFQPVNLADLAALSGYSPDRFRHLFKEKTGLSPLNFIFAKRLEQAEQLLVTTNEKVTTIAMDCGFASASQFCTMFKKKTGFTPAHFRKLTENV